MWVYHDACTHAVPLTHHHRGAPSPESVCPGAPSVCPPGSLFKLLPLTHDSEAKGHASGARQVLRRALEGARAGVGQAEGEGRERNDGGAEEERDAVLGEGAVGGALREGRRPAAAAARGSYCTAAAAAAAAAAVAAALAKGCERAAHERLAEGQEAHAEGEGVRDASRCAQ